MNNQFPILGFEETFQQALRWTKHHSEHIFHGKHNIYCSRSKLSHYAIATGAAFPTALCEAAAAIENIIRAGIIAGLIVTVKLPLTIAGYTFRVIRLGKWGNGLIELQRDVPGVSDLAFSVYKVFGLAAGTLFTLTIGLFVSTRANYWFHNTFKLIDAKALDKFWSHLSEFEKNSPPAELDQDELTRLKEELKQKRAALKELQQKATDFERQSKNNNEDLLRNKDDYVKVQKEKNELYAQLESVSQERKGLQVRLVADITNLAEEHKQELDLSKKLKEQHAQVVEKVKNLVGKIKEAFIKTTPKKSIEHELNQDDNSTEKNVIEQVDQTTAWVESINAALDPITKYIEKIHQIEVEKTVLENRIRELEDTIKKKGLDHDLEKQILEEASKKEKNGIEATAQQANKALEVLEKDNNVLAQNTRDIAEISADLKKQNIQHQKQINDVVVTINNKNNEIKTLKRTNKKLIRAIERLKKGISGLQQKKKEVEDSVLEQKSLSKRIEELNKENKILRQSKLEESESKASYVKENMVWQQNYEEKCTEFTNEQIRRGRIEDENIQLKKEQANRNNLNTTDDSLKEENKTLKEEGSRKSARVIELIGILRELCNSNEDIKESLQQIISSKVDSNNNSSLSQFISQFDASQNEEEITG